MNRLFFSIDAHPRSNVASCKLNKKEKALGQREYMQIVHFMLLFCIFHRRVYEAWSVNLIIVPFVGGKHEWLRLA